MVIGATGREANSSRRATRGATQRKVGPRMGWATAVARLLHCRASRRRMVADEDQLQRSFIKYIVQLRVADQTGVRPQRVGGPQPARFRVLCPEPTPCRAITSSLPRRRLCGRGRRLQAAARLAFAPDRRPSRSPAIQQRWGHPQGSRWTVFGFASVFSPRISLYPQPSRWPLSPAPPPQVPGPRL